jgi:hypothetical protein
MKRKLFRWVAPSCFGWRFDTCISKTFINKASFERRLMSVNLWDNILELLAAYE